MLWESARMKNMSKQLKISFEFMRNLTGRAAAFSLQAPMEVDHALCEFLQQLWENSCSKSIANNTVSGVPHLIPPFQANYTGHAAFLKLGVDRKRP